MHPAVLVVQNARGEGPGLVELHARAAGVSVVKLELFGGPWRPDVRVRAGVDGRFSAGGALGPPSTAYFPQ